MRAIAEDYRRAGLDPADVAMLEYAEKLTARPSEVGPEDVQGLRRHGFGERQILDVVLVTAYRNFVARVADGLGLDLEERFSDLPDDLTRDLMVGRDLLGGEEAKGAAEGRADG